MPAIQHCRHLSEEGYGSGDSTEKCTGRRFACNTTHPQIHTKCFATGGSHTSLKPLRVRESITSRIILSSAAVLTPISLVIAIEVCQPRERGIPSFRTCPSARGSTQTSRCAVLRWRTKLFAGLASVCQASGNSRLAGTKWK